MIFAPRLRKCEEDKMSGTHRLIKENETKDTISRLSRRGEKLQRIAGNAQEEPHPDRFVRCGNGHLRRAACRASCKDIR